MAARCMASGANMHPPDGVSVAEAPFGAEVGKQHVQPEAADALALASSALVLHFEDDQGSAGLEIEPWVLEQVEYIGRLLSGGFSEAQRGTARLPCRRKVFETFLSLARGRCRPATICLAVRMEVLRFADMVSCGDIVQQLAESIRTDYLSDGDGARDSAVTVLCELADLLTPASSPAAPVNATVPPSPGGAQLAPATPSPAAIWLVSTAAVHQATGSGAAAGSTPTQAGLRHGDELGDPLMELREACLGELPPWTRQRFAEKPQLWRLELEDVLNVYGAEASPRSESSWLALHAARRLCRDILPFASASSEAVEKLAQDHPAIVRTRCVSLCIQELPFTKTVSGFGGTEYQIQVWLSPAGSGGWVLGVGGQGLCALRKVVLEMDDGRGESERHDLEFTGLMEHASGRQEDAVLGFNSGMHRTPLPFSVQLMIYEYPLHLAVQTYIGSNFNTMAMLCQGFDFGPMDLACVMDLWLQSDQLRRVPESEISEVVRRTLCFVKLSWPPVVRVSFVVCMHSCWLQAVNDWWHKSLIRSCLEMEVWRGPAEGEPGSGTFRSYIATLIQHALAPYHKVFLSALQAFFEGLPTITAGSLEAFFERPSSLSDPVAIVARHYLDLLHAEEAALGIATSGTSAPSSGSAGNSVRDGFAPSKVTVWTLQELLQDFCRLIGLPLEHSQPRVALLAFLALAALCDLRYQRSLCAQSLSALLHLESQPPDSPRSRFWASCFFTLLEFSRTLSGDACARGSAAGAASATHAVPAAGESARGGARL
mmetsp:Transcript_175028/g.561270  ORF Transcript_175028/g.561270 Transcript_175028/m.561270 type:complete len:770 (-) Transcript_175028:54-2363(-)